MYAANMPPWTVTTITIIILIVPYVHIVLASTLS
jgi:hypothetical protein